MLDFVNRIPAWAKALAALSLAFTVGATASQTFTETRELPIKLATTNARIDTLSNDLLLVRREQATQRAAILEAQRLLRYLTCTTRPGSNDADCVSSHLTSMDLLRIGER